MKEHHNEQSAGRETPRSVNKAAGLPKWTPDEPTLNSPLGAFFYEMLDVPFEQWTDYQVRRAVRQNQCVEQLIPRALAILKTEPLAGGYWTGDLLQLLTQIPGAYWEQHPDQKAAAVEAAQAALHDTFWHEFEDDDADTELRGIIMSIASGTIPEKLD